MNRFTINSYAKINLTLDVLGQRPDGYHNVRMVMAQCGLCDTLLLAKRAKGITLRTNLDYLPCDERNTAVKAAMLFFDETGIDGGADIDIVKRIPVAAGLAGGSGNAAAVLSGLNQLFDAKLSQEVLLRLGKAVGADVPYCTSGGTMLAEGIGELLTPLPDLPRTPIVVVKPDIRVSTAQVYAALDQEQKAAHPGTQAVADALARADTACVAAAMFNVMESVTAVMHPVIGMIKSHLLAKGALGTVMSGSGPSVFALFDDYAAAKAAAAAFGGKYFTYAGWTR